MYEMAIVVAANLPTNPFLAVGGKKVTPIGYIKDGLGPVLFYSERRITVVCPVAICSRVNSLEYMDGALAPGHDETVIDLATIQLDGSGASFIYVRGGCCPLDMRHFEWPWRPLEWHIAGAIYAQLAHRYKFSNCDRAGTSGSKIVDRQPWLGGVHLLAMAALSGGNTIRASRALLGTDWYYVDYLKHRRKLR